MDIRDRINQLLDENSDWSPTSVSIKAGFSNSMLQKFLNPDKPGGIQSITIDKAKCLAEAMGVSPGWLVYGEGNREVDSKVVSIWHRIAHEDRDKALRVLNSFVDEAARK